jgi:thymidylate synthase
MEFAGNTGHEVYAAAVAAVMELGALRKPRGKLTRDLGFASLVVSSPTQMLPLGTRPKLSTKIAAIEAVQLIGGFSDPDLIARVTPALMPYAEPDNRFHGAYGRRIGTQVSSALTKLRQDPDTRQAVITLWDPTLDNQPHKKDYPCTVALTFEVHANRLAMTTVMRSNDVWRGLPYDMFQFTQLQQTMANILGIEAGFYRHVALSLHAYEEDWAELEKVDVRNADSETYYPIGFGEVDQCYGDWNRAKHRAYQTTVNNMVMMNVSTSEQWYRTRLAPMAPPSVNVPPAVFS